MKTFFGVCLLLLLPICLKAQVPTTNIGFLSVDDLVGQCRQGSEVESHKTYFTPCTAYILGVAAGTNQASRAHPKDGIWICIPMGTPKDKLVGVVLKYAESHPKELKAPAWKIVIDSLLVEFPCPNSN